MLAFPLLATWGQKKQPTESFLVQKPTWVIFDKAPVEVGQLVS